MKTTIVFTLLITVGVQAILLHTTINCIEDLKDERDAAIERADVTLKNFKTASEDDGIYQIYIKPLCHRKDRESITIHKQQGEM